MIVVETDRLIVRYLRPDDLDEFAVLTSHPDIIRYMDDGEPLSREQTQKWIEVSLANYEKSGFGCFGVTTKENDHLIGFAGFARPSDRPGIIELIYALAPAYWGKGFATEVARGIVTAGFDRFGLTRIEATVDPANDPSKRVLEKIGMTYDGRQPNDDGTFTDFFSIEAPQSSELST